MRIIDPTLKERMQLAHMTIANNAQPRMEIEAVRPRTPIFHQRFWQEAIVTAGVTATSTSVAVQRSSGRWGQRVYVAYVAGGTLTVKAADLLFPVENLAWSTVLTVSGVSACSLQHDGLFRHGYFGRVEFYTTDLWVFYTTTAGVLMAGILGEEPTNLASSVTAIDATRGVANHYENVDQGILIFYIVAGEVYYKEYIDGIWGEQQSVALAPDTAVSIKATRTFDWRIALHITDASGALHEVFSKMESSGWSSTEFIWADLSATAQMLPVTYYDGTGDEFIATDIGAAARIIWGLAPVVVAIANIDDGSGNYGVKVRLAFNEPVTSVSGNTGAFAITDSESTTWSATTVQQIDSKTIDVTFQDWNNAVNPVAVTYTPGTITGEVESIASFTESFAATGLVPTADPAPVPSLISNPNTLSILVEFDQPITDIGYAAGFSVSYYEPAWVPGGDNVLKSYTPSATNWPVEETEVAAAMIDATLSDTAQDSGSITLARES